MLDGSSSPLTWVSGLEVQRGHFQLEIYQTPGLFLRALSHGHTANLFAQVFPSAFSVARS